MIRPSSSAMVGSVAAEADEELCADVKEAVFQRTRAGGKPWRSMVRFKIMLTCRAFRRKARVSAGLCRSEWPSFGDARGGRRRVVPRAAQSFGNHLPISAGCGQRRSPQLEALPPSSAPAMHRTVVIFKSVTVSRLALKPKSQRRNAEAPCT